MTHAPAHAALINPDGSWKHTNALIHETSPYLRQHAHNPVDWKPWGAAAFAEAAQRDVPIFLSIGYSTCYWCHVMERQAFEDPAIAKQMNEQFVCVKVDREERPDVDDIYMTATQLLTGSGGWPMSVFLTPRSGGKPGLLPFWAGTYIPPAPAYGRPGFPQVMDAMSQAWATQRGDVLEQAGRVADAVREQVAAGGGAGPVSREAVDRVAAQLMQRYDPEHGGFSGPQGPKFPTPSTVALLMDVYAETRDEKIGAAVAHTLDRMARGGMYDQVGGGFHRYSVDEKWLVPHFEKMLYDNGQMLELYALAYTLSDDRGEKALYARVMRETAEYLLREMRDETGAFWSAQDAEVNTKEGENYVWTADQVREALADEPDAEALTGLALEMYGLNRGTNFKDPHHEHAPAVNVLYTPRPMSELVEFADGDMAGLMGMRQRINAALLKVRDARDQPGTDDKVLTAWNGLAIAGLAEAGRVLDEPRYVEASGRAADAVLEHMSAEDGGLLRSMRGGESKIPAFLEDYAFFVHGLLRLDRALGETNNDGRYRAEATRLTDYASQRFSAEGGGYFDTLSDQADLFVRTRSTYDGAVPSGNSQMIHNLIALCSQAGDEAIRDRATLDLRSFASPLEQSGLGMTHMARALWRATAPGDASEWVDRLSVPVDRPLPSAAGPNNPVMAEVEPVGDPPKAYLVRLTIAEGYHLNANPSSTEFLVPTRITAPGVELDVAYPEGELKRYPLAEQPIAVYEDDLEITVRAAGPVESITVEYQACTEDTCLAPATLRVPLP
ncbi:MAG: DUF255 domain-containing protein [Planctomycetota bacterium]